MKIEIKNANQWPSSFGGFLTRTVVLTLATMVAIRLLPGVHISASSTGLAVGIAFITAAVISLLDNFVRPILIFITLPFTLVSMGLFIFIINALIIEMASAIVGPFHVDSFGYALLFSLIVTVLNYLLELPNRWMERSTYRSRNELHEEHFDNYEEVSDSKEMLSDNFEEVSDYEELSDDDSPHNN